MGNTAEKIYEGARTISTQFGDITVDPANCITLADGLIGISEANSFVLVRCPHERFSSFLILQSITSDELSMLVMPIASDDKMYKPNELNEIASSIGVGSENLITLLVVSVAVVEGKKRLAVNTRAPIFIDTVHRVGAQFVIPNNDYEIQKLI